jgi:hypothetical protein
MPGARSRIARTGGQSVAHCTCDATGRLEMPGDEKDRHVGWSRSGLQGNRRGL